jgi:enoyl-CoA hydratase/carnithine racemase
LASLPVRHALRGIWDAKWPLIAKVAGKASGSGLLLAALADFAVVSETALLCLPEARDGVVNGGPILRRCLPEQAMRYMMWSARPVEAKRLRELGAGMLIVPPEELDGQVAALAADVARLDPHLLRHMKIAMNENESDKPLAGHAVEQRYTALLQAKSGE